MSELKTEKCKMNQQTIHILGYPKSGTTWLARLLGDALNSPVGSIVPAEDDKCIATEGQDRPGRYYIRQGHAVPVEDGDELIPDRFSFAHKNLTNEKIAILIRDPRDVAVSAAHHWNMDLEKTLHCMSCGEWPLTHGGGWCEWVEAWFNFDCEPYYYSVLNKYPRQALRMIIFELDILCSINEINTAVERQSITARRAYTEQHGDSLNYGKDAQLRFLRKGITGDWKNHFTPKHRQLAEKYFGETMRKLGYTESREWINE
jgi:hypothetical protein